MQTELLFAVVAGIAALLFLILVLRFQAFLALLVAAIVTGLCAGLDPKLLLDSMQKGMGSTLGFVATVVGLGAIFGAILEQSNGARAISAFLLQKFGEKNAPLAMTLAGFIIAIPVFFDVAFIILIPVLYSLQRQTGRSLLVFALPLLAGLAVAHAFVPPTPGPVAVAEILGANLGWVIILGMVAGLPAALVGGLIFGKWVAAKVKIAAPPVFENEESGELPPVGLVFGLIFLPVGLIVLNTMTAVNSFPNLPVFLKKTVDLIGHPFAALLLANLLAWYFLGIRRGMSRERLFKMSNQSLTSAGIIILVTGAGGVFKQVLIDTQIGKMLAEQMASLGMSLPVFAFLAAALVRVLQGSATVAMITAAGLVAPLLENSGLPQAQLAVLVIAIAAGATIFSHVNDSGFWLVSQYLGLTEKQTFQTWTMLTTVLALVGFAAILVVSWFL